MILRSLFSLMLLTANIRYHVLRSDIAQTTDRVKEAAIAVSVERSLGRTDVEQLICQILADEKPPKDHRLSILVFVGLDEYAPAAGSETLEEKYSQHQLAWYVWNRTLPKVRGRLVLTKDVDGNQLDPWQSREFNHEKTCKPSLLEDVILREGR